MKTIRLMAALVAVLSALPAIAAAADAPPTRYMVTMNRLKPGSSDAWRKAYTDSVIPAIKKAGIPSLSVGEVIFGERPMYVHIRPLASFGELDGPGPLERSGLNAKQVTALNQSLDSLLVSQDRYVVNVVSDLSVQPDKPAPIAVANFFRPNPGQADAARDLLRTSLLPAWKKAKQDGKILGIIVANTGQGNPGLIIVVTYYASLAALDTPYLRPAMGEAANDLYQSRLAQLGHTENVIVTRRVDAMSY